MLPASFQCTTCGAPIRGNTGLGLCSICALRGAIRLDAGDEPADPGSGSDEEPRRFGDYDLLGEVARGGMGVVYRARQRSLGRLVALKVLLGGAFAGEEGRQRLKAEAAAAARLTHPNIVAIHDAGIVDGQPYFSMTLIEGSNFADVVRSGPLPARRAARYLARVAEAVHYAHTHGVLHRDLKPSNVLLDAHDEPHVTDFGLAKSFAPGRPDFRSQDSPVPSAEAATRSASHPTLNVQLTMTGQVLGSPAYMAPEQAIGRSRDLGPAADVYGLGAILYELLAGRPPFVGETPQTIIEQVKHIDPIPLRRLQPGVPADIETVCLKCLEKEPRRRYATAQELADELNRFLRGEPVRARPVGPVGRASRWMRRHRAISFAFALVLLLLIGGTAGATLAALRIKRAERAAVAGLRESLLEQSRARRLAGGLGVRSETIDSLRRALALGLDATQRVRARSEAIGALALDDVRFVPQPQLPRTSVVRSALDPTFTWFAHVESNSVVIHRVSDGRVAGRFVDAAARRPLNGQPEFSGNGQHLAVLYRDRLNIWSITNGQLCFSNVGTVNVFAFSGDGRRFALGTGDGAVTLRELPSGRVLHELPAGVAHPFAPTGNSRRMGLSFDGSRLAVVQSLTNCVDVLDFKSRERQWRLAVGASARTVMWSPDDSHLGVSCQAGPVQVWDARSGELRHTFAHGPDGAQGLSFHPVKPWLAAASPNRRLALLQPVTGQRLAELPVEARKISFDREGARLGPVWLGGQVGWLETSFSSSFRTVPIGSPATPFWYVSFTPDGRLLGACAHRELTFLNADTLEPLAVMTNRAFHYASFDGAGFLWTIDGAGVHRWRPAVGQSLGLSWSKLETRWRGAEWRSLAFSADEQSMAAANRQMAGLLVTSLSPSTNQMRIASHLGARWSALDRNARYGVTGSLDDKRLKVWDVKRNRMLLDLPAGGNGGRAAFSPDGRWLATLGDEGLLWSVDQWTNPAATLFPSGETGLGDGAFAADSGWLAVVANLREIHLFNVANARRVAVLPAPEALGIQAIALSPDGRWLVALCQEGRLQRWHLAALKTELAALGLGF
jgi:serine/threonine protein kinase/WD40 repeat protein